MSFWLRRGLAVDASLENHREKREREAEESQFVLWRYLIGKKKALGEDLLVQLVEESCALGFDIGLNQRVDVYPLQTGDEPRPFHTLAEVAQELVTRGGVVVLTGMEFAVAFEMDPLGVGHSDLIRKTGLRDKVAFGEYTFWMPVRSNENIIHGEEKVSRLATAFERIAKPSYGCSLSTAELETIPRSWPCHAEVARLEIPTEVFWYQYFSDTYSSGVCLDDFRQIGFSVEDGDAGGKIVRIATIPSAGLEMIGSARPLWRHRTSPTSVC